MDQDRLAAELDMLMAVAGVPVPAERRERLLASYADLREQVALLRAIPDATAEPAGIFHAVPATERTPRAREDKP
jgi:hypothetical protein